MSLWKQEQEGIVHDQLLREIATDCIAYAQHGANRSIIERWSKEQLAFALDSMTTRFKMIRNACGEELKKQHNWLGE